MADRTDRVKGAVKRLGRFSIVFMVELLLLLAALIYIFVPKWSAGYDIPQFDTEYTLRVDNQRFGRYIYRVEYSRTEDAMAVGVEGAKDGFFYGHVNSEGQILRDAYSEYELEYWVTGVKNDVEIRFTNMYSSDAVRVNRVIIRETDFAAYVCVILALLAIGATCLVYCIVRGKIKKESVKVLTALAAITFVGALPVFTPYLQMGADSVFHLNRIEGIKESLLAGQFPVRVDSVYLNGYGYAVSTFYGSLFFYIPVAARLIGFSLQFSYKIFVMFLNIIMVVNSYFFFKKITRDRKWGIAGSFCFTLFTYKFINMYSRGAISEASAMAVLPLLANVFYDVFTAEHDAAYKRLWVKLTLAFSLVVENHIISTEIFGVVMILICVFCFRKTFNRDTFVVLLKFTVATLALNAFFLVPFVQTITGMEFNINAWTDVQTDMQSMGYRLDDWFYVQIPHYNFRIWYEQAIKIIPGLSAALMFLSSFAAAAAGVFKSREGKLYKFFLVESIVVIVITSAYFPWNAILDFMVNRLGGVGLTLANMLTNIQFLFRITVLADLFFTGLFVLSAKFLVEKYSAAGDGRRLTLARVMTAVVMLVTLGQTLSLETAVIATQYNSKYEKFCITDLDEYFCKNIGNEEYIPRTVVTGWSWSGAYDDRTVVVSGGRACKLSKKGTHLKFTVQTDAGVTGWVDIPLIYYFGYHAYNTDTGEELAIFQNNSGKISFIMPESTTWNVEVVYRDEPDWKIADMISLVALMYMVIVMVYDVRDKRRRADSFDE